MLLVLEWMAWVTFLHGKRASMFGVGGKLACVGWIRRVVFLVCFEAKMKKRFQIDRNSDLKEELDLKSSRWFIPLGPPMQGS